LVSPSQGQRRVLIPKPIKEGVLTHIPLEVQRGQPQQEQQQEQEEQE
jgi:hypothetical protein